VAGAAARRQDDLTGCRAPSVNMPSVLLVVDFQERLLTFGGVGRVEGSFVLSGTQIYCPVLLVGPSDR
jgi:hypothetical protein